MTTLTKQEQERSLSKGKRKRTEKAPKIILCNPFRKYWPEINEDDSNHIKESLSSLLTDRKQKTKIPWKNLIKLPKEIRKERVNEINRSNLANENIKHQRKRFKIGLNSVSRAIQHLSISSCLLAGDVQPDLLISHLVTAASTRGIPVLIVPKLKEITFNSLGFSCTAFGVSKTHDDDDQCLRTFDSLIVRLSLKFPLPLNHAWILRKNKPPTEKKKPSKIESEFAPGDIFIDRLPGISKESISPISHPGEESSLDFIPVDSAAGCGGSTQSATQLRDDFINNLLYIAPNFKRMQKNNNKFKRKKTLTL